MSKAIAIMQPYFMPYIGYFQLIAAVDYFVLYDNIQYTKKGWISRNKILQHSTNGQISLPIKKSSSSSYINSKTLAENWDKHRTHIINKIAAAYNKAPYFTKVQPLLDKILSYPNTNLFEILKNSIELTTEYLGVTTPIVTSSSLDSDPRLKSQERVLDICKVLNARVYVNPIGGIELYNPKSFLSQGIGLKFLQPKLEKYSQFNHFFTPQLSIIDVLMFNSQSDVRHMLTHQHEIIVPAVNTLGHIPAQI